MTRNKIRELTGASAQTGYCYSQPILRPVIIHFCKAVFQPYWLITKQASIITWWQNSQHSYNLTGVTFATNGIVACYTLCVLLAAHLKQDWNFRQFCCAGCTATVTSWNWAMPPRIAFFTSVCSDDYKKIKEGSNTKQVGATRFLFHQALQLWTSAGASKHSCHAMTNQVHVRLLMAHSHTASDTL